MGNVRIYIKFAVLVLLLLGLFIFLNNSPWGQMIQEDAIQEKLVSIRSYWWAPLLFIGIYVLGAILAMPSVGLSAIGGVVFGFWPGIVFNLIAVNIGASFAFGVSRSLGRDFVKKIVRNAKFRLIERVLAKNGLRVMIALRILPVLPFNVVNYGSALTRISYRDYFLGSILGMVPSTVVFTFFANSWATGQRDYLKEALILVFLVLTMLISTRFLPKSMGSKTVVSEEKAQ